MTFGLVYARVLTRLKTELFLVSPLKIAYKNKLSTDVERCVISTTEEKPMKTNSYILLAVSGFILIVMYICATKMQNNKQDISAQAEIVVPTILPSPPEVAVEEATATNMPSPEAVAVVTTNNTFVPGFTNFKVK